MSYTIYKSDGSAVVIPDNLVDQNFNNSTANFNKGIGLQIVGAGSANYVIPTAQNFLQLVENYCGTIIPPDTKALQGQLWFNKTSSTDGTLYVRVSGALVGGIDNWSKVITEDTPGFGFVPYYIGVTETFTVPVNKQALFSIPIVNDGTIVVDGYLVGV